VAIWTYFVITSSKLFAYWVFSLAFIVEKAVALECLRYVSKENSSHQIRTIKILNKVALWQNNDVPRINMHRVMIAPVYSFMKQVFCFQPVWPQHLHFNNVYCWRKELPNAPRYNDWVMTPSTKKRSLQNIK